MEVERKGWYRGCVLCTCACVCVCVCVRACVHVCANITHQEYAQGYELFPVCLWERRFPGVAELARKQVVLSSMSL